MLFLFFLINILIAEPMTIVVEEFPDVYVYVAPIELHIYSNAVESIIAKKSVYGYSSQHWKNAKVKDGPYVKDIDEVMNVYVFDQDSYIYKWENCDYKATPKECSNRNDNMLLETHITIDDHQITVQMILLNSDMTINSQSIITDESTIKWIKQQEMTVIETKDTTITHIPKEELPLKWLIPANLMNKHIEEASLLVWARLKIN